VFFIYLVILDYQNLRNICERGEYEMTSLVALKPPMRSFHALSQTKHLRLNAQIAHLYKQLGYAHFGLIFFVAAEDVWKHTLADIWKRYKPDFIPLKLMENCITCWQLHKVKNETVATIQLSAVSLFVLIGDSAVKKWCDVIIDF